MTRLGESEGARFEQALTQLYAVVPSDAYPVRALTVVRGLIGCVHCSYNELDLARSKQRVVVEPAEVFRGGFDEAFRRYLHQHPVIAHVAATGDSRSRLISDFITPRAFRRLELYNELFRPLGTEAQLSLTLSTAGGEVVAVALNRDGRGFSECDRALLDRLQPHLRLSHENAKQLSAAVANNESRQTFAIALDELTERQLEVLRLVAEGQTNDQIAYTLGIASATAKKHVEQIRRRLAVPTRTAAAARYLSNTHHAPAFDENAETEAANS